MSIESAKAFIESVQTDEEFRERMKDAADKEARIALVNAEGFDFSEEDIKAVKSELSDDELDAVAGGGFWCKALAVGTDITIGPFGTGIAASVLEV